MRNLLPQTIATLALAFVLLSPSAAHAVAGPVVEVGPALVTQKLTLIESGISAVKNAASVTKEYILDTLAWEVANMAIESITASTVNWINSGFQGSPAFVTDLQQNLRGVDDAIAARFFEELSNQEIETTPFQDRVLDAVRLGYYLRTSPESFYTRYPNTLSAVSDNPSAFLAGDFSQGGWDAWFQTVMNPSNNPLSALDLINRELEDAVSSGTGTRLQELSWNRGFLQWCGDEISGEQDAGEQQTLALGQTDQCVGKKTRTPGVVIQEQLNQAVGSGMERLTVADDFNEIIGALLNQLALQVLGGGNGGGLVGASRPSAGGGASFIDSTRGQGSGSGAGLSASFLATIQNQRTQVERFQANWTKIRGAAEAAAQQCGSNGTPDAQAALDRAGAQLVRAADALAAIAELEADISEANAEGGNQSAALAGISSRYGTLINTNVLPTPEEISEAENGAQDTGDADPGSLYSQLMRQSSSLSCRADT
ncbi:MAG TPA: hypothetical protein VGE53_02835 [Candidatus Paceibacterota bacterium]